MQNEGSFGVIFWQNMSWENAKDVKIGDLVWIPHHSFAEMDLIGPLLVVESRDIGYGCNRRTIWKCHHTDRDEYHTSEGIHLYQPAVFP